MVGVEESIELEGKLVHGLRPQVVELVEYDPRWPMVFEQRRERILGALGPRTRFVEHIGSTAVPGLAAKPVIDIVAGIDSPDDEPSYLPALTALGYTLTVREPGHRCLRGGTDGADADLGVNLHCYPPDSDEVHRYRLLRDRLRSHPDDRAAYEATKRSLAGRGWPDVNL